VEKADPRMGAGSIQAKPIHALEQRCIVSCIILFYTTDLRRDCPTEAEVRLEVKKDEDSAIEGARSPLQGRSATAFLIAGLQIEDAQWVYS
jgi:hypothetical protein